MATVEGSKMMGHQSMEKVYISVSGLIGAGKSSLAKALGDVLGLPVYYEPVKDNVYLADFYKDMSKHAFAMQIFLLNARFQQQQQIVWSGQGAVQDRTIFEDAIFAKMLRDSGAMDPRDYDTYIQTFTSMSRFMGRPNCIVHLDVSPEESLRRIRARDRDCESGITIEYLTALYHAYEDFLADISRAIPVLRVDWSEFRSTEEVAARIKDEYAKLATVRDIKFPGGGKVSPIVKPDTEQVTGSGGSGSGSGSGSPRVAGSPPKEFAKRHVPVAGSPGIVSVGAAPADPPAPPAVTTPSE